MNSAVLRDRRCWLCAPVLAAFLAAWASVPAGADEFDTAQPVAVVAADQVSVDGEVTAPGESQTYSFIGPADGFMLVEMQAASGDLDPILTAFSDLRRQIGANDNASDLTADSAVRISVKNGLTYYVRAAGVADTTGQYTLVFTSLPKDDAGNTIDTAKPLKLRRGKARGKGMLEYDGDADVFCVTTANAAPMTLELIAASRTGTFDGTAAVYDAIGDEVACQPIADGLFKDAVGAAQTYYIEVVGTYTGDRAADKYKLNVYLPADTVGNTIDEALALRQRRGKGKARSSVDFDWDVDVFCAVAASTSPMTIDLVGKSRDGSFDGELRVYNAAGTELAYFDDPASGNAQLAVATTVGESYYIEIGGVGDSVGKYNLTVLSPLDDHGNTIDLATTLVESRGKFSANGTLDFAGDVDMFCVVSPVDGQMGVSFAGSGRTTTIDPEVTVFDDQGGQIAHDDGNGAGGTASFSFDVAQGGTYYVQVEDAAAAATGKYLLTLTPDAQAGPPPLAEAISVDNSSALSGYVTQDIVFHTDTDWLSAQMVVELTAGTIYQDPFGTNISPNPLFFPTFPTLEFDSYVSNGTVGGSVSTTSAPDLDPGAPIQFDTSGISIGWFTTGTETGALALARVTLSDNATGTWQFRATASPALGGPLVHITGTIANGVMTAD